MATRTVTPFPSPQQEPQTPEGVSQAEIARLLANRNRLRQLKELVETHEGSIKARLEAGADVEPGDHIAKLKESIRRCVAWKDVVVRLATRLGLDGEAYCANVLGNTKPTRTVGLFLA